MHFFAGWGNLAYYSIGSYRNSHTIPKLSSQWRISFKVGILKYGSLTIETQGEKALIMKMSPVKSPAEIESKRSKKFANGASFKMGHQVEVEVGIPNETGDSVELIHLKDSKEGEDNYSLTVKVDGLEVGKTSCCSTILRNLTDVSIISGLGIPMGSTRDLRDLIVMDKA